MIKKKKKILVLTSTFPRWKNDTTPPFVFELEKRLSKDFEIHVLAPHYQGAKKEEMMEGLRIHRFQYFWPAKLQKLCYEGGILPNLKKNKLLYVQALSLIFFELISAIKIVRKEKISLIHAHWIIPQGIIALIINRIFHVPYTITSHGGDIFALQGKLLTSLKLAILNNAKNITVVSFAIKKKVVDINPQLESKIQVIPMGVDSKLFNPNKYDKPLKAKYNPNGPILLFVGRLAEKKGVEYLIRAMPLIIKKLPAVKLLIVGSGTLENKLKELTNKLKLNKNIIFIGPLSNSELPKYYATADIFIGPSIKIRNGDTEGLGLTFVEASFSGCVPIGTNIGGITDIIKNNQTGFIIREKNVEDITNTIVRIFKNNDLMIKIKNNSRIDTVKKFDWKIITYKYKRLYCNN